MNYSLLITVCSLAAGMLGMERWCSWRLNVVRRGHIHRALRSNPVAEDGASVAKADDGAWLPGNEMAC